MHPQRHVALRVHVLLQFKPGAAVGNYGCAVNFLTRLIARRSVVNPGRADKLGNDYTLRAVYYKRAGVRHKRELAHEHGLVYNFFLYFVYKPYGDV